MPGRQKGVGSVPAGTRRSMPAHVARRRRSGPWHWTITVAPVLLDEWGIADELKGVAQALLGEQQDGLALKARAVPERLTGKGAAKSPGASSAIGVEDPKS